MGSELLLQLYCLASEFPCLTHRCRWPLRPHQAGQLDLVRRAWGSLVINPQRSQSCARFSFIIRAGPSLFNLSSYSILSTHTRSIVLLPLRNITAIGGFSTPSASEIPVLTAAFAAPRHALPPPSGSPAICRTVGLCTSPAAGCICFVSQRLTLILSSCLRVLLYPRRGY